MVTWLLWALPVIFMQETGYAFAETEPAAISKQSLVDSPKYHRVKNGDTLYAIGLNSGHGYQKLALWNHIAPPYLIIIGQTLKLFPPITANPPPDKHHKIIVTETSANTHQPSLAPVVKQAITKEKKSIISIDNKKMLKLNFKWPLNGNVLKNFSQSGKQGIDIKNKTSKQPVLAAESGQIVYVGQKLSSFRNLIIIKHSDGYLSAYANTSRLLAKEGQQVEKGQVIAEILQSTLHFEIRKNGNPVDPLRLLQK